MPASVQSGSASWDNCGQTFPDKLCVSLFLDRLPHYAWTTAYSALWLQWIRAVCVFRCSLPPALLAEWLGSFTHHCRNTGVARTPNKSQHTKLTLEKKSLLLLLSGLNSLPFHHESSALTNELSLLQAVTTVAYLYMATLRASWVGREGGGGGLRERNNKEIGTGSSQTKTHHNRFSFR